MTRRAKFEDASAAKNARDILIKQGFYVFTRYEPYISLYILRWF